MSLAMAYDMMGFIHGDLHLGNVLLKRTKQAEIVYKFGEKSVLLPTMGYKIVIMDFEKSRASPTPITTPFWGDVYFLCKCVENSNRFDGYYISWENTKVTDFLHEAIQHNYAIMTSIDIFMGLVFHSKFTVHMFTPQLYNPNV